MSSRFQSFDEGGDPAEGAARIAKLRAELTRRGLQGFVVPRADEHQSEYVPKNAERLAWLTGFTGSAGTAVILLEAAALVVDGRYALQAPEQVDTDRHHAGAARRDQGRGLDRGPSAQGRLPRLRPVAAHGRRRQETGKGRRECRRLGRAGRHESRRRDLGRSPSSAERSRAGAPGRACRREQRGQAGAHPREARQGQGRRPCRIRSPQPRLDVQHPRRRRRPYAAAARLRGHPRGRPPDRVPRSRQGDERGGRGARRCCRHRRAGGPRRRPRPPGQGQGQDPYR